MFSSSTRRATPLRGPFREPPSNTKITMLCPRLQSRCGITVLTWRSFPLVLIIHGLSSLHASNLFVLRSSAVVSSFDNFENVFDLTTRHLVSCLSIIFNPRLFLSRLAPLFSFYYTFSNLNVRITDVWLGGPRLQERGYCNNYRFLGLRHRV